MQNAVQLMMVSAPWLHILHPCPDSRLPTWTLLQDTKLPTYPSLTSQTCLLPDPFSNNEEWFDTQTNEPFKTSITTHVWQRQWFEEHWKRSHSEINFFFIRKIFHDLTVGLVTFCTCECVSSHNRSLVKFLFAFYLYLVVPRFPILSSVSHTCYHCRQLCWNRVLCKWITAELLLVTSSHVEPHSWSLAIECLAGYLERQK